MEGSIEAKEGSIETKEAPIEAGEGPIEAGESTIRASSVGLERGLPRLAWVREPESNRAFTRSAIFSPFCLCKKASPVTGRC
jgi:hypothetical protein